MIGPSLAAAGLLVVLAVSARLARRHLAGTARDARIRVEDRARLSHDAGVAVVHAGGVTHLVGWGREGVRLLGRLDRPGLPSSGAGTAVERRT